jgi:hypothetical protein
MTVSTVRPVREAEWAEGWRITALHSTSDLLEEEGGVAKRHMRRHLAETRYDRVQRRSVCMDHAGARRRECDRRGREDG